MNSFIGDRVIVIRNPFSSHATEVQHGVIDRLRDELPASQLTELWTPSANKLETIEAIAEAIQPGDTVLVAAGDGTGNAAANAYMQTDSEGVRLGFLPYGNFNDMAATFTDKRAQKDPLRLIHSAEQVKVHPLEVGVNGNLYRYALLYTTLGWTALAAATFDNTEKRKDLQTGKANLAASLASIAKMYFATRASSFMPPFMRDGDERFHANTTDVLAINGPVMAKIIRSQVPFYAAREFLSKDLDVSSFFANTNLLARSGLNFVTGSHFTLPGTNTTQDTLHFNDASLPVQLDGEFEWLTHVDHLTISKDQSENAKTITVQKTTR